MSPPWRPPNQSPPITLPPALASLRRHDSPTDCTHTSSAHPYPHTHTYTHILTACVPPAASPPRRSPSRCILRLHPPPLNPRRRLIAWDTLGPFHACASKASWCNTRPPNHRPRAAWPFPRLPKAPCSSRRLSINMCITALCSHGPKRGEPPSIRLVSHVSTAACFVYRSCSRLPTVLHRNTNSTRPVNAETMATRCLVALFFCPELHDAHMSPAPLRRASGKDLPMHPFTAVAIVTPRRASLSWDPCQITCLDTVIRYRPSSPPAGSDVRMSF